MRRVVGTFVLFVLAHLAFAFTMRRDFGTTGTLTVAVVGVAAIIVVGIPAFVMFRRHAWLAWWQLAAGGGIIGVLCTLPFSVGGIVVAATLAPAFAAIGVLHGLAFWLLAVWCNPALDDRRH